MLPIALPLLLDPAARIVIAHRGDNAHAPENTLVAFERARAAGADAFECDVRLSLDGRVVIIHDDAVDRTTDGTGSVARMAFGALRELDAGARWTAFARQGLRIPLLAELLDAFPSMPVLIECKTVAVASRAVGVVVEHGAADRVLFGAFPGAALAIVRNARLATIATRRELIQHIPAAFLGLAREAPAPFRAVATPPMWKRLPLPVAGFARTLKVPVHVWTVNDPDVAVGYWRDGVCGIITDDPARMLGARALLSDAGATLSVRERP